MSFKTTMPNSLKEYYFIELDEYQKYFNLGNFQIAWRHLERAHVIGQSYPYEHSFIHWKMLQFGFIIKSPKEIFGQIPRLLFGGVKSFIGKIPTGNTGGANVPPLRTMPIENDILEMFLKSGIKKNSFQK